MSKLRSIDTKIWSDTWFEELCAEEKLLFIYLITNEKTNMLGVYEMSKKKISFETSISISNVEKHLKRFENDAKIIYRKNNVILCNFLKHQKYNSNMMVSAVRIYNELSNELKIKGLEYIKEGKEGFETLCEGFGTVRKIEIEIEDEIEVETKKEKKEILINGFYYDLESAFDLFWNNYQLKKDRSNAFKKFEKIDKSILEIVINKSKIYGDSFLNNPNGREYQKLPSTWLNGKNWEDEINITSQQQVQQNINPQTGQPLKFGEYITESGEVKYKPPFAL